MATATSNPLREMFDDFVSLIHAAIDRERVEAGDEQPKRVTLEGVEVYDAVPIDLHQPHWHAGLERAEDYDTRRGRRMSATYRLFWR